MTIDDAIEAWRCDLLRHAGVALGGARQAKAKASGHQATYHRLLGRCDGLREADYALRDYSLKCAKLRRSGPAAGIH